MTHHGEDQVPPEGQDLHRAAEALSNLAKRTSHDPESGLQTVVRLAAELVGDSSSASVTVLQHGRLRTVASSSRAQVDVDLLQYDLRMGPCVDAVMEDSIFFTDDIEHEDRWQPLGKRLKEEQGIGSMMAFRLHPLDETEAVAALNFSSPHLRAFAAADLDLGLLLATQCALLLTASQAQTKADNLVKALQSNREIGVAIGVLMHRYQLTHEQAFNALRVASQDTNRKLVDVAADVVLTGTLSLRRWPDPDPTTNSLG